jgi:hypothetical protein
MTRATIWNVSAYDRIDLHPSGAAWSQAIAAHENWQVGVASLGDSSRAQLWHGNALSAIDLHPAGADFSIATGIDDTRQVGAAYFPNIEYPGYHAGYWLGSAQSWVDLHPRLDVTGGNSWVNDTFGGVQVGWTEYAFPAQRKVACIWYGTYAIWFDINPNNPANYGVESEATAIYGDQQVGWARLGDGTHSHAGLWHNTAESFVDLNPPESTYSVATDVYDGTQVGSVSVAGTMRASLWRGSALSWVDLSRFLPTNDLWISSEATGIWKDNNRTIVVGTATSFVTGRQQAILWVNCPSNFDDDAVVTVGDLFAFLDAWFVQFGLIASPEHLSADIDGSGNVSVADLFSFLDQWFQLFGQNCI